MNAHPRHLVALVVASNLLGCQLIKKFTDRNHDSGAAPTGTTVVTLDGGGMALPNPAVVAYDAAAFGDAGAAANAAMAAAADASAQANQALQNAQNALADAGANTAVVVPTAVAEADAGAAMAAPPGVAPTAPVAAAQPAAPAAPTAEPEETGHRSSHRHDDYCRRHPGQLHPRTGQICPNILGSQNLQR